MFPSSDKNIDQSLSPITDEDYSIHNMLVQLGHFYDIVRVVDVVNMIEYTLDNDGILHKGNARCFQTWGRTSRCEDCISAKAFSNKGRFSKLEFLNDKVYHVSAKFVRFCNRDLVIELVDNEDQSLYINSLGHNTLIGSVLEKNKKLYIDILTNVYNRRYYEEYLKNLPVSAIAVIDIDNFKSINDTYGHIAGDTVIKNVAHAIHHNVRDTDAVVRYGGDEFIIIFNGITKDILFSRLSHIRHKIEELKFTNFSDIHVTISIGAVQKDDMADHLLAETDKLLYIAKKKKNTVELG